MITKIMNRILRRQEVTTRCVAQFSQGNLRARVLEMRDRQGSLEYWIDVQWDLDGNACSSIGLLRRTTMDLHFDVMREAHAYLHRLSK